MPLTSAFGRQMERNLYEFDTSLVYIKSSSHPGYIVRPYLKIFFKKEERDGEERREREGRREGVRKGGRERDIALEEPFVLYHLPLLSLFMKLVLAGCLLWFLRSGHSRLLTIKRLLG